MLHAFRINETRLILCNQFLECLKLVRPRWGRKIEPDMVASKLWTPPDSNIQLMCRLMLGEMSY